MSDQPPWWAHISGLGEWRGSGEGWFGYVCTDGDLFGHVPEQVYEWSGLSYPRAVPVVDENDAGRTFAELANLIEATL